MDLGLTGRSALVFGAGGGIGGGIARALATEGAHVVVADRDPDASAATVEAITASGGRATAVRVQLGDHEDEARGVAEAADVAGPVEVLVNNTGGPPGSTASGVELASWREHFESMVASVIHITDLVLPGMRAAGWGRIVTNTSSGVITPIPGLGMSNTLRSALVGWSKTVANEVGRDGITSNVVVPGRIASRRALEMDVLRARQQGRSQDEVAEEYFGRIPVGRYGTPEEFGDAVAFLASERAGYITGSVLRVDGGMIDSV